MCSTSFGRSHNPHRGVEPTGPDSEGAPTSPNMFPLGWPVLIFFLGGISEPKEMRGGNKRREILEKHAVSYIATMQPLWLNLRTMVGALASAAYLSGLAYAFSLLSDPSE